MTTETLRLIVDRLNEPPFNRNLSLIAFDSLTPSKLLQTLSDVLSWIEASTPIDIRSETPDETAMRLLSTLRVLKYPPPRDMDHIHKWRLDILEGEKAAIYPILEWVLSNVDSLKERIYLSRFLTRIEVPPEEVTPDIQRIQTAIDEKIEEFKMVHTRMIESRSDFAHAEDVLVDLKSMEDEKEQLLRKIDRVRRIAEGRGDIQRELDLAAKLRTEMERSERLALEKQEQRNALLHIEQRVSRLVNTKAELEREKENINPQNLIDKLKREIETNTYLVDEKLTTQIAMLEKNIQGLNKIVNMQAVTNSDVQKLKKRIDVLNADIINLTTERDQKDEEHEDKLSIFRHQSANVTRKKQAVGDQMQLTRKELEDMEAAVAEKKEELAKKTGHDDIITNVAFKRYVVELRTMTTSYKKLKAEDEKLENEKKTLQRTVEILSDQWKNMQNQLISEGRGVIETITEPSARPKTAKPTTKDVSSLRAMTKDLTEKVEAKKTLVDSLRRKVETFANDFKAINEEYESKQAQFNVIKSELEGDKIRIERELEEKTQMLEDLRQERERLEADLQDKEFVEDLIARPESLDDSLRNIESQFSSIGREVESQRVKLAEIGTKTSAQEQVLMWKGLAALFEKKIQLANVANY